jgi:hypothetical protein
MAMVFDLQEFCQEAKDNGADYVAVIKVPDGDNGETKNSHYQIREKAGHLSLSDIVRNLRQFYSPEKVHIEKLIDVKNDGFNELSKEQIDNLAPKEPVFIKPSGFSPAP